MRGSTDYFLYKRVIIVLEFVGASFRSLFAGNHRVYKMASKNLAGVYYDIHEIETCSSDDFVISYKLRVYFDYFLNPLSCVATRTGILQFEQT